MLIKKSDFVYKIRQIIKGYNPDFDNLQARENTWMGTAYIVSNTRAWQKR